MLQRADLRLLAMLRQPQRIGERAVEIPGADRPARAANRESLQHVAELAHVAPPGSRLEARQRLTSDDRRRHPDATRRRLEPRANQQRDVFPSLAERGQLQTQHVETEVEIGPEAPRPDLATQIAAGGGYDASRQRTRASSADALVLPFLEDAEQTRLETHVELPHLVEEQGAAGGELQASTAPGHRSREGAPLVAEELALDERWGERRAVGVDPRAVSPLGPAVQCVRCESLPHTGLSRQQHRGIEWCDPQQLAAQTAHGAALAHDLPREPRAISLRLGVGASQRAAPLGAGSLLHSNDLPVRWPPGATASRCDGLPVRRPMVPLRRGSRRDAGHAETADTGSTRRATPKGRRCRRSAAEVHWSPPGGVGRRRSAGALRR